MNRIWHAAIWAFLTAECLAAGSDERADVPTADVDSVTPAASNFQPGEISIGEPLQVPFRDPAAVVPKTPTPPLTNPSTNPSPVRPFRGQAAPQSLGNAPPASRTASQSDPPVGTGWLGFTVDDTLVPGRMVIVDVAAGGPAAKAGLLPQDALLGINGSPIRTSDEMAAALAAIIPGSSVKMAISRGDRVEERVAVAVERPATASIPQWQASGERAAAPVARTPPPAVPPLAQERVPETTSPAPIAELPPPTLGKPGHPTAKGRTALGVRTVAVGPDLQARYQLESPAGAYVIGVVQDLPASKAGVPPGSVIVALGNQPVRDPGDLTRLVTSGPVGAPVTLQYVLPGGQSRRAEVVLQSLETPLERALVGEQPTATDPGSLAPVDGLRRAERRAVPPQNVAEVAEEVQLLRRRLETLERRLDSLEPRSLR